MPARKPQTKEAEFDNALSRVQAAIPHIALDSYNEDSQSWFHRYSTLDAVVRPIYTKERFSICFGEKDCPTAGKVRIVAFLSRGGITREYAIDVVPPMNDEVTFAVLAAHTLGKRHLLISVFNIVTAFVEMDQGELKLLLANITAAPTLDEAKDAWKYAIDKAKLAKDDQAIIAVFRAYEDVKKRLAPKGAK